MGNKWKDFKFRMRPALEKICNGFPSVGLDWNKIDDVYQEAYAALRPDVFLEIGNYMSDLAVVHTNIAVSGIAKKNNIPLDQLLERYDVAEKWKVWSVDIVGRIRITPKNPSDNYFAGRRGHVSRSGKKYDILLSVSGSPTAFMVRTGDYSNKGLPSFIKKLSEGYYHAEGYFHAPLFSFFREYSMVVVVPQDYYGSILRPGNSPDQVQDFLHPEPAPFNVTYKNSSMHLLIQKGLVVLPLPVSKSEFKEQVMDYVKHNGMRLRNSS